MKNVSFVLALGFLVAVFLLGSLRPLLGLPDPHYIPSGGALLGPSMEHWFGTDQLGRDEFTRLLSGARRSITIGVLAAAFATIVGLLVGAIAGWFGRVMDTTLMRGTEVVLAMPSILLAGSVLAVTSRNVLTISLAIGLTLWPVVARFTRSRVRALQSAGYVESAMVSGASRWWTLRHHVLPNVLTSVLTLTVTLVAVAIVAESSLAFIGLGPDGDAVSWGTMIVDGRRLLSTETQLVALPSLAIALTVLALGVLTNRWSVRND